MDIPNWFKRFFVCLVLIAVGMFAGALWMGTASARTPVLEDSVNKLGDGKAAAETQPDASWEYCTLAGVATFTTRVHVECNPDINGIQYFAVGTLDSKHAARILATLLTAQAAGKNVFVNFDPEETSNLPPGCLEEDCRFLYAVGVP